MPLTTMVDTTATPDTTDTVTDSDTAVDTTDMAVTDTVSTATTDKLLRWRIKLQWRGLEPLFPPADDFESFGFFVNNRRQ